jgi:hypothetical protein
MVTHLTKPSDLSIKDEDILNIESVKNLIKILEEKEIKGSNTKSGYIIGNRKAVCFQDAPMYGIIQNVEFEKEMRKKGKSKKVRYSGNGLAFSKYYAYDKGSRPVLYEKTSTAKKILHDEEHWRIVNLEISTLTGKNIDWMHEREWRVPENFKIDYKLTHVILYNKESYDYFMENCDPKIIKEVHGITVILGLLM